MFVCGVTALSIARKKEAVDCRTDDMYQVEHPVVGRTKTPRVRPVGAVVGIG